MATKPEFNDGKTATAVDTGRAAPSNEAVKQDLPVRKDDTPNVPQSYVHLANGQVLRVNDEDLPGASGVHNQYGHWQTGNKVYDVIGIYPVETTIEES